MHIVKKPVWEGCRVCDSSHVTAWTAGRTGMGVGRVGTGVN